METVTSQGSAGPRAGLRTALWYQRCDRVSGVVLGASLVFAPWAFGGTPPWAIWTLNGAGYLLGLLLGVKLIIRGITGFQPVRWDTRNSDDARSARWDRAWVCSMAALTVLILLYCGVAAWNARAEYDPDLGVFHYRDYIRWLPHSYDASRSWQMFATAVALACYFWAARDWLLGKTMADRRDLHRDGAADRPGLLLPQRFRILLGLLSINGALLATEAVAQRLSGTDKLLWLVRPRLNAIPEAQLGPFNYRSNGAQYLNLVWPVTLGLWWRLHRMRSLRSAAPDRRPARWKRRAHHLLLPAAGWMAATSVFSLSRGGAVVALGSMLALIGVFWTAWRERRAWVRLSFLAFLALFGALGLWLGGEQLGKRFEEFDLGLVQRETMYQTARQIASDYPWYGTGPGTLGPVFQLYRKGTEEYWPAQLHNDWLEIRVTWGRIGMALLLLAFGLAAGRVFLPGGVPTSWRLPWVFWIALGGCLLHARWDFPLQVYSLQHLTMVYCAALACLSHRRWAI
jgi:hypothetical protein